MGVLPMLGMEQLDIPLRVAAVIVPAAVYFLLLGLLNSQRTPQLIRGRTDFVLLIAAFLPTFCVPMLNYLGASFWTVVAVMVAVLGTAVLVAPPRAGSWVIYNIHLPEALRAAERTLQAMGRPFCRRGRRLVLDGPNLTLRFSSVPLLKNVSIAADGKDRSGFQREFEGHFGKQLGGVRCEPTPMAATFLLLAAGMLVTPLALVADRMPEMVRVITDLVR